MRLCYSFVLGVIAVRVMNACVLFFCSRRHCCVKDECVRIILYAKRLLYRNLPAACFVCNLYIMYSVSPVPATATVAHPC